MEWNACNGSSVKSIIVLVLEIFLFLQVEVKQEGTDYDANGDDIDLTRNVT